MFFEFIATITAGFAAAGVAMLLGKLTGGRLPKWLMPVMAGGAMLAYAIWSEYSWFSRTQAGMPEGFVVVSQNDSRAFYRPWTYIVPMTDRFAALDTFSVRTNDTVPDLRLADMYLWGRWAPVHQVPVAFDCADGLQAVLDEGVTMDAQGRIENADWRPADSSGTALMTACEGG